MPSAGNRRRADASTRRRCLISAFLPAIPGKILTWSSPGKEAGAEGDDRRSAKGRGSSFVKALAEPAAGTQAASDLRICRILAPVTTPFPSLSWRIGPGATFLTGSVLGTLSSKPPAGDAGTAIAEAAAVAGFVISCGFWRPGILAGEQVLTAPGDGILTWCLDLNTPPRRLDRGTVLACYFPLGPWQAYERLVAREEAVIRAGGPEALSRLHREVEQLAAQVAALQQQRENRRQADAKALSGGVIELAEQLIIRESELASVSSQSAAGRQIAPLLAALRRVIKQHCPVPPRDFFRLLEEYFGPLLVIEERFLGVDDAFLRRLAGIASEEERASLLAEWQECKEAISIESCTTMENSDSTA